MKFGALALGYKSDGEFNSPEMRPLGAAAAAAAAAACAR